MRKRNLVMFLICISLLLGICFYSCCTASDEEWEAIQDPLFENGFALSPLDPRIVHEKGGFEKSCVDTLRFEEQDVLPIWKMAQWYSHNDLANTSAVKDKNGGMIYMNHGKRVIRNSDGSLWLEINTSCEYEKPREDGEPWPHLLIEQSFVHCPNIGKVKELNFSIDIRLEKCERKMTDSEYNPGLHTAQSPFYFVLKNVNHQSKDFNSFIWLGIPSFDYRYQRMNNQETTSWDIGTSTYIYNVPQLAVWGDIVFQDNQWHEARIDILPLIRQGVENMREKGYFKDTVWDDLEISGMNFGWEIPGTFDAAVSIKNLSLKVVNI